MNTRQVKLIAIVILGSAALMIPGVLLASGQLNIGGDARPLIATVLILTGFMVPFLVPRK